MARLADLWLCVCGTPGTGSECSQCGEPRHTMKEAAAVETRARQYVWDFAPDSIGGEPLPIY